MGTVCHTILILRSNSDGKLLWAGGSRRVKLIDGVGVPPLGRGNPTCQQGALVGYHRLAANSTPVSGHESALSKHEVKCAIGPLIRGFGRGAQIGFAARDQNSRGQTISCCVQSTSVAKIRIKHSLCCHPRVKRAILALAIP